MKDLRHRTIDCNTEPDANTAADSYFLAIAIAVTIIAFLIYAGAF
jgi:hypothetical protein